jgi:hypothetical protein
LADVPETVLQTEAALRVGRLVQDFAYQLEVTPRPKGADLAAARDGTVWATFHLDVDPQRPLQLRVGATIWGGARANLDAPVEWTGAPPKALDEFVRQRFDVACRRGREENPDHCAECPIPGHRV